MKSPVELVAFTGRLLGLIGGFSAISRIEPGEITDRELSRIRAQQIDAVTRHVPLTMSANLVSVAIVLALFWNTGSNVFLSLWALVKILRGSHLDQPAITHYADPIGQVKGFFLIMGYQDGGYA